MNSSSEKPLRHSGGTSSSGSEDATIPPSPPASNTDIDIAGQTAKSEPPTKLPATFGRYQLQKLLGKGGMGAVYLAHDTQLDRLVTLKIPLFTSDESDQVLARFYREARSAATILHPNVCPVHDVGEVNGVPYLTMGYIEGKSLAEWVRAKPLTPRQSAALVRKLALALQEAHKKGVIHRDLKPANIMIDKRGEPIIMDFGLARRNRPGDARLTQTGAVMGTPAYMPPEQISGNPEAMGPACDIYSLGVILYELLAGRLPFQGDPMAMLSQVLLDQPPPPSQICPDVDTALERICLKAMDKKVEARYASMAEFAAVLQDYVRLSNSMPPQPKTETSKPARKNADSTVNHAPVQPTQTHPAEPVRITKLKRRPARRPRQRRFPLWTWIAGGGAVVLLFSGILVLLCTLKSSPSDAPKTSSLEGNESRPGVVADDQPHLLPEPPPPPVVSPPPAAPGFAVLFNGKDLSGWENARGDPTVWRVEKGAMMFQVTDTRR